MSNTFSKLFGRSPFGPMQDHMSKSYACAEQLIPFFSAVLAEDWEQAEKLQQGIAVLENEADEMKGQIRANLPESLFMPVPRSDLLELLTVLIIMVPEVTTLLRIFPTLCKTVTAISAMPAV